ncbi:MAG: hypothetical protein QM736_26565 [Vicinamibacterales bacterium]
MQRSRTEQSSNWGRRESTRLTLWLYGSLSYNPRQLRDNITTALNTFLAVRGLQTPDTPHTLARSERSPVIELGVSPVVGFVD